MLFIFKLDVWFSYFFDLWVGRAVLCQTDTLFQFYLYDSDAEETTQSVYSSNYLNIISTTSTEAPESSERYDERHGYKIGKSRHLLGPGICVKFGRSC